MPRHPLGDKAMTDAERQRKHRGPHLSDHQKLAQARAEIARLRKAAEAKAEPLTDATRRKLEGELMKVKLETTGCASNWLPRLRQCCRARSRSCARKSRC